MAPTSIDDLPLDILYHIFSFFHPGDSPHTRLHPFLTLSLTSKSLHAHVEAYCRHLLGTHKNRFPHTRAATPAAVRKLITKDGGNLRGIYLSHAWSHCAYCNCKSVRRAIMVKGMVCCKACDDHHWSGKITMGNAMKKYHLTRNDLFGSKIIYSRYMAINFMFLEADVCELAERIHGDLPGYLQQLAAASAARRQKREDNRALKIAHLRSIFSANGLEGANTAMFPNDFLTFRLFNHAMSPLLICRNAVLSQRYKLETQYDFNVNYSLNDGFSRLHPVGTGGIPEWDLRLKKYVRRIVQPVEPGERAIDESVTYYRDPRDYALWELFRKDFGLDPAEGSISSDATQSGAPFNTGNRRYVLYYKQASSWGAIPMHRFPLPRPDYAHPVKLEKYRKSVKRGCPPWGWPRYPQLVVETSPPSGAVGDDTIGEVAARERKKVRRNEKLRKDYEEVKEWLTEVLRRGGIESPDTWSRAVGEVNVKK